jgi:hypothetical protein
MLDPGLPLAELPNRASASLRASTQNPAVRVFDRRQDRTRRFLAAKWVSPDQSIIA